MARGKKKETITDNQLASPPVGEPDLGEKVLELSFSLRRELEEICKNTGKSFEVMISGKTIEELEDICNKANNPPAAWRTRWDG